LALGGLLVLLVGAAGGTILAMTQIRNIVREEVRPIVEEELAKSEEDLIWCMSHPSGAACKPATGARSARANTSSTPAPRHPAGHVG
jgi:hypothetical protein